MNYIQILQSISKYSQLLYQDGSICWSSDESLSTPERKAITRDSILIIKDQLAVLEAALDNPKQ